METLLHVVHAGMFRLDGGAMFGVVPKQVWSRTNPADENNLCPWAMRCLLVQQGERLILVDTGIGTKMPPSLSKYYYLFGDYSITSSLSELGFTTDDITDVLLTHLHLDHVGGATQYNQEGEIVYTFKNATYWVSQSQWENALQPNPREKASFLKENLEPLLNGGRLQFLTPEVNPFTAIELLFVDGHTQGQVLPVIETNKGKVAFMGDLIPSASHVPLPYVASYDISPLLAMQEKEKVLQRAVDENWLLFFEHDPVNECARVVQTEKGVRVGELIQLNYLFN